MPQTQFNTIDGQPLYYIYSPSLNRVVCMCRYVPDSDDISSRGEMAIDHNEIIPLEFAQYNEATKRIEKIVPDVQETPEQKDYRLIMNEMVKDTARRLKQEGKLKSDYWKNYEAQPMPLKNPRIELEKSRREFIKNNKDVS